MEMIEIMRRQNDERAEEFQRTHEEARLRMEDSIRVQEQLHRRNEELQRQMDDRNTNGHLEEEV